MANLKSKKQVLFNLFSSNLHMLSENRMLPGLTLKYDKTYICPLCLEQFSEADLDSTRAIHLTLEHVPPESLGGKHYLLTCNICNNRAGDELDNHLTAQLNQVEKNRFLPNSEYDAYIKTITSRMQVKMKVAHNGKMTFTLFEKNNDPKKVIEFNEAINADPTSRYVTAIFRSRRAINFDRIPTALLKIAYLLAFEQFGYLFIMDTTYDVIRRQISQPEYTLYPYKFWAVDQLQDAYVGTHIVRDSGLQSIMSVFPLVTKRLKFVITTLTPLPSPFNAITTVLELMEKRFVGNKSIELSMHKPKSTYLYNLNTNIELDKAIREVRNYYLGLRTMGNH